MCGIVGYIGNLTNIKSIVKRNDHILTSDIEHNAVIRPLENLKRKGVSTYSTFKSSGDIEKNIRNSITKETSLIVSTLSSNVTGYEIPIEILSKI